MRACVCVCVCVCVPHSVEGQADGCQYMVQAFPVLGVFSYTAMTCVRKQLCVQEQKQKARQVGGNLIKLCTITALGCIRLLYAVLPLLYAASLLYSVMVPLDVH